MCYLLALSALLAVANSAIFDFSLNLAASIAVFVSLFFSHNRTSSAIVLAGLISPQIIFGNDPAQFGVFFYLILVIIELFTFLLLIRCSAELPIAWAFLVSLCYNFACYIEFYTESSLLYGHYQLVMQFLLITIVLSLFRHGSVWDYIKRSIYRWRNHCRDSGYLCVISFWGSQWANQTR